MLECSFCYGSLGSCPCSEESKVSKLISMLAGFINDTSSGKRMGLAELGERVIGPCPLVLSETDRLVSMIARQTGATLMESTKKQPYPETPGHGISPSLWNRDMRIRLEFNR